MNFYCLAPGAKAVSIIGDFNRWEPNAHPMKRHPDGSWAGQAALHHGHHQYQFLVDGKPTLDPRAHGVAHNSRHGRVSVVAVS